MAEHAWQRLSRISETNHRCLDPEHDICMFLMTRERHFKGDPISTWSESYKLVKNFKITPSELKKNPNREKYKRLAIERFTVDLRRLLATSNSRLLVVPAVTSKPIWDPEYDDRLVRVCREAARLSANAEFFDMLKITHRIPSAFRQDGPRDPNQLMEYIEVGSLPADLFEKGAFDGLLVVDDVVTTGAHFKACQQKLKDSTGVTALGAFWARTESIDERNDAFLARLRL